jgi:hypothetical protein
MVHRITAMLATIRQSLIWFGAPHAGQAPCHKSSKSIEATTAAQKSAALRREGDVPLVSVAALRPPGE